MIRQRARSSRLGESAELDVYDATLDESWSYARVSPRRSVPRTLAYDPACLRPAGPHGPPSS